MVTVKKNTNTLLGKYYGLTNKQTGTLTTLYQKITLSTLKKNFRPEIWSIGMRNPWRDLVLILLVDKVAAAGQGK